jgi:hypothetical protein
MDPDQHAHLRSLISIYAVRLQVVKLKSNSMNSDQTARMLRLISILVANALCWFCHGAAQLCLKYIYIFVL